MSLMSETRLFALGLLIMGLGMFVFALVAWIRQHRFLARARATTGRVIELVERGPKINVGQGNIEIEFNSILDEAAAPRIEYSVAQEERSYRLLHNVYTNPPSYDVGEEVELLYDPKRPEFAIVPSSVSLWGKAVFFAVFGVALLIGSAVIWLR